MHFAFTPYALPSLVGGLLMAALTAYAWRHRGTHGAAAFTLFTLSGALFALGYTGEAAGTDLATKLLFAKLEYVGIAPLPVAGLVFALAYTGRDRWLTPRTLRLLALVPTCTLLIVLTNDLHGLHWSSVGLMGVDGPFPALRITRGPWWYVHVTYSYGVQLLATALMVQAALRSPALYRAQVVALLAGALVPWLVNLLYISGLSPFGRLDITPPAFAVTSLLWGYALFHLRLLDLMPVAHEAVLAAMQDGVIVLDRRGRVVDLNPAALRLLGRPHDDVLGRELVTVLGRSLDDLLAASAAPAGTALDVEDDEPGAAPEVALGTEANLRYYEVRLAPLAHRVRSAPGGAVDAGLRGAGSDVTAPGRSPVGGLGELEGPGGAWPAGAGWIVLLRDVTEQRRSEEYLRQFALYDLLTGLPNRRLLLERLQEALAQARRQAEPVTLLVLDLQGIGAVNDSYGLHCGDALLRQVAARLLGVVRSGVSTLARLRGAEFAVVLPGTDQAGAAVVGSKLLAALADPFPIEGPQPAPTVEVGANLGIATFPADGADAIRLLERATARVTGRT